MTRSAVATALQPRWTALLCWLGLCAVMLIVRRDAIADFTLSDADDALRLVQVRDLMAGQGWFDTTQYRINPPDGGMMHWSRLIDLPIALGIGFLSFFTDHSTAETIVLAGYPLVLLGLLFAAVAYWLRSYGERAIGHIALVVLATSATMLFQFTPMRIDHHSWQAILAVVAIALAVRPANPLNGALIGLVVANYVAISIEGAAYLALFGAILAFEFVLRRERGDRFIAFCGSLALSALAIVLVTRGPSGIVQSYCDAVSRPYLLALLGVFVVAFALRRIIGDATLARRLVILAAAGGAGLIAFAIGDSACLGGPFEALDPRVRTLWYENIREGLPVWDQVAVRQVHLFATALLGLVGAAWAWRTAKDAVAAERWRITALAALGAFLVSVMVFRTISVAHIYALPGIAWLLWTLMLRARAVTGIIPRIAATLGVFVLVPLFFNTATSLALAGNDSGNGATTDGQAIRALTQCIEGDALDQLGTIVPTLVFAPLDLSPFILEQSQHSVIATGHHRNQLAMRMVIDGFAGTPDNARRVIETSGATLVVQCNAAPEIANYRRDNPAGLAAMLERGETPDWLEKLPSQPGAEVAIYRVRSATEAE